MIKEKRTGVESKMEIKVTRVKKGKIDLVDWNNLGFGEVFTDHMFSMDYESGEWVKPRIEPFGNMLVSPAMCTLHYAQSVFEGMKAYLTKDGSVNLFRPEKNFERINRSAEKMCIPPIDKEMFFEALCELIKIDKEWIPKKEGYSLYIRPFIFGTEVFLGVHPSSKYRFMIILSPVGSYYKNGFNPVSLLTSGNLVRAVKDIGDAKTAGNYASSLHMASIAKERGFDQVLWLNAGGLIDEGGAMNIFFVIEKNGKNVLVTPSLDRGTILPGITRDSIIQIAEYMGTKVEEKNLSIDELVVSWQEGELKEAFGTGTAAVISPVGVIQHGNIKMVINDNQTGPIAKKLYEFLTGIQYGKLPDNFEWVHKIE